MDYPVNSNKRELARVTFEPETVPWEFDIRAVPPGKDPLEFSDWHRRLGRANNREGTSTGPQPRWPTRCRPPNSRAERAEAARISSKHGLGQ